MEDRFDILIAWLKAHGPDDWHRVAEGWNWDDGVDILEWIAEQPECDRATAQLIFLLASGEFHKRFPVSEDSIKESPYSDSTFTFLEPIILRWNAGFYTRSGIASDDAQMLASVQGEYRKAYDEAKADGRVWSWNPDPSIYDVFEGHPLTTNWSEGWPPEVLAEVQAREL